MNFMICDANFNKITFIDWSQMFIMLKHYVFNDLSYAITMFNVPLKNDLKCFEQLVINLMVHDINFSKVTFIHWSQRPRLN
jgi:hypothetical protein